MMGVVGLCLHKCEWERGVGGLQCHTQDKYQLWAKGANFDLKLPRDIAACKKEADKAQQTLNADLVEKKLGKKVLPHSDQLFKSVAIEWLVGTDQVIYHNLFKF